MNLNNNVRDAEKEKVEVEGEGEREGVKHSLCTCINCKYNNI